MTIITTYAEYMAYKRSKQSEMKQYICSYNDENTPDFESDVFQCWADNEEHAKEQCQNAYPNAFVADVYLADEA